MLISVLALIALPVLVGLAYDRAATRKADQRFPDTDYAARCRYYATMA